MSSIEKIRLSIQDRVDDVCHEEYHGSIRSRQIMAVTWVMAERELELEKRIKALEDSNARLRQEIRAGYDNAD